VTTREREHKLPRHDASRLTTSSHGASKKAATKESTSEKRFYPKVDGLPALPAIDFTKLGQKAPILLDTPAGNLPKADIVVITWASAEWAAMEHVFIQGSVPMPYSKAGTSHWDGWQKYSKDMPAGAPSDWTYWGYYRLVKMQSKTVLLFKSNTHLDWPGQAALSELVARLCTDVQPQLIMSIGTAGGCRPEDHVGTVSVVNAGTMYESGKQPSTWPKYASNYKPGWSVIDRAAFSSLLFAIPSTTTNLQSIADQFNSFYGSSYSLSDLNANGLCLPTTVPAVNDLTPQGTSLLTASTFVVGTTSGEYKQFSVIEMDDAVIAQTCKQQGVSFGFVRNVSDPAQNPKLPAKVQGDWGSAVYDVFGFYTSYNGALAAWGVIAAMG
jgi:nucleoside phosphorylase